MPHNTELIEAQKQSAASTISRWWRQLRSSGKSIVFNPKGNHSEEFHTFLHHQHQIPKKLTYFQDLALLADIQIGNWNSPRFKTENVHFNAMNLFAAGKIDWQQKSTISDIVESSRTLGRYIAYPILTADGEFTDEAKIHLLPYLKKFHLPKEQQQFNLEEIVKFKQLILQLPISERFIFIFPEQQLDHQGSYPARHSVLLDNLVGDAINHLQTFRLINRQSKPIDLSDPSNQPSINEFIKAQRNLQETIRLYQSITSDSHPTNLSYQGVLKLSFGAENALGKVIFGESNWWSVVPCLGTQTIDDLDELSQRRIRPTSTPESRILGFTPAKEHVHGEANDYPVVVAHDDYHRKVISIHGENIHQAIERIITLARQTFGYKWSKDIWLLRDFDLFVDTSLVLQNFNHPDIKVYTTRIFAKALMTIYILNQLENCSEELQDALILKVIMFDENIQPRQIALAFVIDLVRNPQAWDKFNILSDEQEYLETPYYKLIQMARLLNHHGAFKDDMKANIIKFDYFIRIQNISFDFTSHEINNKSYNIKSIIMAYDRLKQLDENELAKYTAKRDNRRVFLGFEKDQENHNAAAAACANLPYTPLFQQPQRSAAADDAMDTIADKAQNKTDADKKDMPESKRKKVS